MGDTLSRLARWRLGLAEGHYDVPYRAGLKLLAADALSRTKNDGTDQSPLEDEISTIWDGPQDIENER